MLFGLMLPDISLCVRICLCQFLFEHAGGKEDALQELRKGRAPRSYKFLQLAAQLTDAVLHHHVEASVPCGLLA